VLIGSSEPRSQYQYRDAYFKLSPNCGSGFATGKAKDPATRRRAAVKSDTFQRTRYIYI